MQLVGIDIAATERANNEPAGSFLKRAFQPPALETKATLNVKAPTSTRRTINTRDLEATRRAREASEAAYERRRLELGLPTLQETQRQATAETEAALDLTRRSEALNGEAETYWRGRASALRTETAALDAEIGYLRARLAETSGTFVGLESNAFGYGAYPLVTGSNQFPIRKLPRPALPLGDGQTNIWGANQQGAQLAGRIGFGGGATRGRIFLNASRNSFNWREQRQARSPFVNNFPTAIFAAPFATGYSSYEGETLAARLSQLEAQRAGLVARQRELEDEARRAGAFPGWLRP